MELLLSLGMYYEAQGDYYAQGSCDIRNPEKVRQHGIKLLPSGIYERITEMTKKGQADGTKPSFQPVTWVSIAITAADEGALDKWLITDVEIYAGILTLVDGGHSVSIKTAPDGNGFMCTAIGLADDCNNKGLGLSGFAADPGDAIKVLLYKHFNLCGESWPRPVNGSKSRFR